MIMLAVVMVAVMVAISMVMVMMRMGVIMAVVAMMMVVVLCAGDEYDSDGPSARGSVVDSPLPS